MIIKVCGMREAGNIRNVETTGTDWMGFIFYAPSSRFVSSVPEYLPTKVKRVGVFVNSPMDYILQQARLMQLELIQLHGEESPELCTQLRKEGFKVIKAFSLKTEDDIRNTDIYNSCCDYFLFDTPCTGYGGSGKKFDWQLLEHYKGNVPFLLSGGLSPDSLEELSRFHHPRWAGIDLNSGFETSPAVKDAEAIRTFIKKFKSLAL